PDRGKAVLGGEGPFALIRNDRYLRVLAAMLLVATIINTTGQYVVGKLATERSKTYASETLAADPVTPAPQAKPPSEARPESQTTGTTGTSGTSGTPRTSGTASHDAVEKARSDYLARFYSDYYTLVNLLSFLLQALIVARLLTHLGIRRALFIMPLVV